MLTEQGCRLRRENLWRQLPADVIWAIVTEPAHLIYFADFHASPFVFNSQGAAAALILGRDGRAVLIADNVQEPFLERAHVSERIAPLWYRCVESAGPRRALVMHATLDRLAKCEGAAFAYEATSCPAAIVDSLSAARPNARFVDIDETVHRLRRTKAEDEVAAIRESLAAATAGLHAAMDQLQPGMTEFDAYRLVQRVTGEAAGRHALVYGDFVSGPRCENVGGAPSDRAIAPGDLVLLDFSVVLEGYRGDFCNTFVCGGKPTAKQRELFDACSAAMQAGERQLRPGVACRDVYAAVRGALAEHGLADRFPHHAGHGVGLGHPESPFLVPESTEMLQTGDVLTLEPGVYLPGVAGMRYERDYLITAEGYELLSHHRIDIEATSQPDSASGRERRSP